MHPVYLFKCVSSKEFEDLDEIVARYVQPMASFARDLLNHKYYQDCNGGDKKVSLSWDVGASVGNKGVLHKFLHLRTGHKLFVSVRSCCWRELSGLPLVAWGLAVTFQL